MGNRIEKQIYILITTDRHINRKTETEFKLHKHIFPWAVFLSQITIILVQPFSVLIPVRKKTMKMMRQPLPTLQEMYIL